LSKTVKLKGKVLVQQQTDIVQCVFLQAKKIKSITTYNVLCVGRKKAIDRFERNRELNVKVLENAAGSITEIKCEIQALQ